MTIGCSLFLTFGGSHLWSASCHLCPLKVNMLTERRRYLGSDSIVFEYVAAGATLYMYYYIIV